MRATCGAIGSRGGATPHSRESPGAAEPRTHARARPCVSSYECTPDEREGAVNYERSVISMHQFD